MTAAMKRGPAESRPRTLAETVALAFAVAATAILSVIGLTAVASSSDDEGVVRVVGMANTGWFRALDTLVSAPALVFPLGTRVYRAGLVGAVLSGVAAALALDVVHSVSRAVVPRIFGDAKASVYPVLLAAVASVMTLAATLAPLWQTEATAPGGSLPGVVLLFVAVRIAWREGGESARRESPGALALCLGFCASYEPFLFVTAALATAPRVAHLLKDGDRVAAAHVRAARAATCFALGLAPLAFTRAALRRAPELAIAAAPTVHAPIPLASLTAFLTAQIGVLVLGAAAAGFALALWKTRDVRAQAPTLGLLCGGALAAVFGAPRSPAVLAASIAVHAFAAIALAAAVLAIARVRVPFARASAVLVVVLELVIPVSAADETIARRQGRVPRATATWTELAWGPLPPASVVLVSDAEIARRVAAAHAVGDMRGDLLVVPAGSGVNVASRRALIKEPALAPILRDLALGTAPEELSLARLSSERTLIASFDPRWDRRLSRHLVPVGVSSRFEPAPRGIVDRRHALEAFAPLRDRLVRVVRGEPALSSATASFLRARALAAAASGERELLSRTLDDLRPFAPNDAVADALVRRIVTTKGPIDVRDLGR